MAAPYSEDLRRKIVQACEQGTQSQREVAEFFNVSLSFVEALLSVSEAAVPSFNNRNSPVETV
jgi:transposase